MDQEIQEFVYFGSWFEKKYMEKLRVRYFTIKTALNIFLQTGGKHIVETGSIRSIGHGWRGDGNATIVFGDVLSRYDGHLWTVDVEKEVIQTAKEGTKEYKDTITYICEDSLEYLQNFDEQIDLLYLDSYDCSRKGDASEAQEHNLKELHLALPLLAEHAVVIIDDNWYENGGKAQLSKEHLQDEGWICILDLQQTLWMRR